jgi:hypothetical protein
MRIPGYVMALIGIVAAAAPSAAAAQQPTLAGADSATNAQIGHVIVETKAQGLPTDPIVAIVNRGVLLHMPPQRLLVAARAVSTRLAKARAALEPAPTTADIAAGGDALAVGVSEQSLRTIRAASPNRPVAVPLGVLTQLVAGGVAHARATDIVTKLIRAGATNVQLVALGNDVNSDVATGNRADASLEVRLQKLTPLLAPMGAAQAAAAAQGFTTSGGTPPKKP